MAWAIPRYEKEEINKAAKTYIADMFDPEAFGPEYDWARYEGSLAAINNWRAIHAYPLNILQMNLRRAVARVDYDGLVAQRTKRLTSIVAKLVKRPKMKLTQMQDIGGCRAVVNSLNAVHAMDDYYLLRSRAKHTLVKRDDYIAEPQGTGYRGIHLVYRYVSDKAAGQKYNDLKIEMQLRSQYQHAWATAVETAGTFIGEELKSGVGSAAWLRFFQLMGSVIALREKSPPVPNTPSNRHELRDELDEYAYRLNVENRLIGYAETMQRMESAADDAYYFLLKLDPATRQLSVTGFRLAEQDKAQEAYAIAERDMKGRKDLDAVLVSAGSLAELQRAYPNYFADTRIFVALLQQALTGHQRKIFTGAAISADSKLTAKIRITKSTGS